MKSVCKNSYFEEATNSRISYSPLMSSKEFEHYTARKLSERYHGVKEQVTIGTRECGTEHIIDVVNEEVKTLVECKRKITKGSIDKKLMQEIYDLQYALDNFTMKYGKWERAVLLVGGHMWDEKFMIWLKEKYVLQFPKISIVTYEDDVELKSV